MGDRDKTALADLGFQTLKEKVYEAIRKKIVGLELEPGKQLVEKHLADELGVSKSPIRDAFQRLEREGLVYIIPFRGCYVPELTAKEFKELSQLREALEVFCLEQRLRSYTDEDIEELKRITCSSKKDLREGDQLGAYGGHLEIHRLIVVKLGNELMANIYSGIIENKLRRYLNKGMPLENRVRISSEQHDRMIKAIEKRDVELAVAELKSHLFSVLEDYLRRVF